MELTRIATEIRTCTHCPLHLDRTNAVPGEGPLSARLIMIGEAPGKNEDLSGRPFVGRSGGTLNEILGKAGLNRNDIFITSVVKCRPPLNRKPRKGEVRTCVDLFARRQIEIVDPEIVCLLGGTASETFLGTAKISLNHGRKFTRDGRVYIPTYHPAAALRSKKWYSMLLGDMKALQNIMACKGI